MPRHVHSKLREANLCNYNQLEAVILGSIGDISVIHGDGTSTSTSSTT